MNKTRDLALCAVATVAIVALGVVARLDVDQSGEIITGIVGLGGIALGRLSGATGTAPTAPVPLDGDDYDTSDLDDA